jgi:hypothetical protein
MINNRLQWIRTCTPWTLEYTCSIQARQNISDDTNLQNARCQNCLGQCEIYKYSNDLSILKGPSVSEKSYYTQLILSNSTIPILPDFPVNSSYYLDGNYLKLSIVPLNSYVTTYEETPTYSWSEFISEIGGQTAL